MGGEVVISNISAKSTYLLINKNIIGKEKENIFIYGFELLFSTIVTMFSILIIALILNDFLIGIFFLTFFMPIRLFVGGAHAKTYIGCFVFSNVLFLLICGVAHMHFNQKAKIIFLIFFLINIFYIWMHAPIIKNRQNVCPNKVKRNRGKAKKILCIEVVIVLVLFICTENDIFYNVAVFTTTLVSCMMFVCRKEEKE